MKNSYLLIRLGTLLFGGSIALFSAQQAQTPPTAPPPEPPAGAANGPNPGPATKTQAAPTAKSEQEAAREFLAIGAPPDPDAVKRGQATFVPNCGFCHGSSGKGGSTGPSLVRSTLVLHDGGTAKEIGPVVKGGRQAKGMPAFPNLTDAQIHDVALFLLKRTQEAANRMEYKILNIVTGDPKAGEAYFGTHCASCHSGSGDLAHIATKFEPVALQGRFLYPRAERNPYNPGPVDPRQAKTVTVTLSSGESYSGTLDHLDDFSVSLTASTGEHRTWLFDENQGIKLDVHDPLKAHSDLLPKYTDADMHNILAYLETMK